MSDRIYFIYFIGASPFAFAVSTSVWIPALAFAQPVLSADHKGTDTVFRKRITDGTIPVFQIIPKTFTVI